MVVNHSPLPNQLLIGLRKESSVGWPAKWNFRDASAAAGGCVKNRLVAAAAVVGVGGDGAEEVSSPPQLYSHFVVLIEPAVCH